MQEKAICLLSGGMDSTVAMAWAVEKGWDIYPLWFNYDQKHGKEFGFAKYQCQHFNTNPLKVIIMDVDWCSSCLLKGRNEVTGTAFVPGRNIIQLAYAGGYALEIGAKYIVGGWNVIDYGGYPDCRPLFLSEMQTALNTGLGVSEPIFIHRPLIFLNKAMIIQEGLRLGVPLQYTWSCYKGEENPCHTCNSCINRDKGFLTLGMKDPLEEGGVL